MSWRSARLRGRAEAQSLSIALSAQPTWLTRMMTTPPARQNHPCSCCFFFFLLFGAFGVSPRLQGWTGGRKEERRGGCADFSFRVLVCSNALRRRRDKLCGTLCLTQARINQGHRTSAPDEKVCAADGVTDGVRELQKGEWMLWCEIVHRASSVSVKK